MTSNDFKNRWMEDIEYIKSIKIEGGLYIFKIECNPKWIVNGNENAGIKMAADEEKVGVYYYYAKIDDVSLDDMFEHIESVVSMNLAIEEKAKLFKQRIDELKVIFENNDIEHLRNLEFVIKEVKGKRGRKPKKKVDDENVDVENTQKEENETNDLKTEE